MNVSLQNIDKVSALLTLKVEKSDYQEQVEKSLKTLRQKAQLPGFRKGMVPAGLIRKMYGKSVLAEEINKIVSKELSNYIKENNINILGEPLPNEDKQTPIDFDVMEEFEFVFDLPLTPEINVEVTATDEVPYYNIDITDEMIDNQIKNYTQRNGNYEKVDSYQDKDMVKGILTELDENGVAKEDGIKVEDAVIMPSYMEDAQKALFNDAKVGDAVTFNPYEAFNGHQAEIASLLKLEKEATAEIKADFSLQIAEITRFVDGELNQEIFDQVYGEGTVKTEEEFRTKVKESIAAQFVADSDYRFLIDARKMLETKTGKLEFPDALLKRYMLLTNEDKGESFVEENYDKSIVELSWQLTRDKLATEYGIKVEQEDLLAMAKEATRAQFAQYGMMTIPDDILDNYAGEMLTKKESIEGLVSRVIDSKLARELKSKVKLQEKTVSTDEFNKLFEEKE